MKVVAWLSALMICSSLYAAFRLEDLIQTRQAESAPAIWRNAKVTAQETVVETAKSLLH